MYPKYNQDPPVLDERTNRIVELMKVTADVMAFEFDGVWFVGERTEVIKQYVDSKTSKKFYVWLHDNCPILHKGNNVKGK
jgi:hypothetical protein